MSGGPLRGIDCLVLAGGFGTRIRPVLGDLPKVLAPVGGRPALALVIAWLRAHGADRIVLALGHQAGPVIDWVSATSMPGCDIVSVVEPAPLGTAGALRHARPNLRGGTLLVVNGDTLLDADIGRFLADHRRHGTDATVLCVARDDTGRYGRIELDQQGRVATFAEKGGRAGPGLINAGVYLIEPCLLDVIDKSGAVSLEHDVLSTLGTGSLGASQADCRFVDLGVPAGYEEAQSLFANDRVQPAPAERH